MISLFGLVVRLGAWIGCGLTQIYADFFQFPFLYFSRSPHLYVLPSVIAFAGGLGGAAKSVWSAVRLPPAVAMTPPAPPQYRRTRAYWLLEHARVSQLSLMVLRYIFRWLVRAVLTTIGISLPCAILVGSMFVLDSVEKLIDVTFFRAKRQHATPASTDPVERSAVDDVRHMPGVLAAEPFRHVPVRIRFGHRERRTSLLGKLVDTYLSRALNIDLEPVILLKGGVALSKTLAELIHVRTGDIVELEVLEGRGQTTSVPVIEIVERCIATQAIMELDAVSSLLDEAPVVNGVHFAYDIASEDRMFTAVKNMPSVAAIASRCQTLAENIYIITRVYLVFASALPLA